jgi:hypothetical protein
MSPRTLVIILAETRAAELTFTNFQENVLQVLGADLAVCIGTHADYDTSNPYYQHAKYRFTYPEPADGDFAVAFDEAYREMAQQRPDTPLFPWRNYLKVKDQFMGGIRDPTDQHPGSAAILIFFRWFLWQQLVTHDVLAHYDRFVITRSDFIYRLPHPSLDILGPDHIWIPDQEGYGGYTDRHVVLTPATLEPYLNILAGFATHSADYYDAMMKQPPYWNLEKVIQWHLIQTGVDALVRKFPYIMYSVRAREGTTRWASGNWSESHGYYIKYPTEYAHASGNQAAYATARPLPDLDAFYRQRIVQGNSPPPPAPPPPPTDPLPSYILARRQRRKHALLTM